MSEEMVFSAPLWRVEGGSWMFVTTSADVDADLRLLAGPPTGFGSVRVEATIGSTTWRTSVFPSRERGYELPVKQAVRRAEDLGEGDLVTVRLTVLDS